MCRNNDVSSYTSVIKYVFEEYMLITQWKTHSLDSFNKEYPYKTFDKFVLYGKEASICETFWNGYTIKYKIYNTAVYSLCTLYVFKL